MQRSRRPTNWWPLSMEVLPWQARVNEFARLTNESTEFGQRTPGKTMSKLLIKNGRIVTAVDDYRGDILIEGDKISVIGAKLTMEADRVIDAKGKLVIPGGIDPHTHMELPFG